MSQFQISAITLPDLLLIEDDPSLIDFRCGVTDLPIWPQVRVVVLRMMLSDLLYGVSITGTSNAGVSWTKAIATMLRSIAHNFLKLSNEGMHKKICITADGVADQWLNGKYFNRLSDHFVTERPSDFAVLADHHEWRWPFPRHCDQVILHAPWQAMSAARGRTSLRAAHFRQASELVELIADRAQRQVGWTLKKERRTKLIQMLASKTAAMPWQYSAYTKLLVRIRPKLLMVGAGCYGPNASLIAAAKSLGICTAEYQHGAVSAGHDAYNFSNSVINNPHYKRTLPEHFLGYGKWWNDQINAPITKWPIGNPHRTSRLRSSTMREEDKKDILILSDGIDFKLYLNLARNLRRHCKTNGWRIVLRPHPLERTLALKMSAAEVDGLHIDDNVDLYHSFKSANTVVSELSTGLFEAVGIVKRIFIWDTPKSRFCYPIHPFETFDSFEELLDKLTESQYKGRQVVVNSKEIWAENWELNFGNFLLNQNLI